MALPPDFTAAEFWAFVDMHGGDLRCLDDPLAMRRKWSIDDTKDAAEYREEMTLGGRRDRS